MKRLKLLLLLLLICFGIAAAIEPDARTRELMEQTWKEFRQIHPYGFQTVALKHLGKGSIIIASEPSPYVSEAAIDSIFKYHGGYCEVMQQKLGHDGWMRDVVGYIPGKVTTGHRFTKNLFKQLYGTDYKAYYTDLDHPSRHVYFVPFEYDLNYTEQLQDLIPEHRLTESTHSLDDQTSEIFPDPFNNAPLPVYNFSLIEEIWLNDSSNIIIYSEEKGYVAWLIDIDDEKNCLVAARQFTLDTDLILGAVWTKNNHLIIIGRERQVPVTIYPPLRPETILLMAQNRATDLEQYFDAKNATTDADGQYLTPIVMSKRVQDSEYGNLLVMCDQMLKSWTENDYNQDDDYNLPAPAYFPFARGVYRDTKNMLYGYYWNQDIVNKKHLKDSVTVFTTDRTGSLPVKFSKDPSYQIPESEKASEYFAELNQPELVRLAQYTMLHEIFSRCYAPLQNNDNPNLHIDIYTPTNPWLKSPSISRSPNKWKQGGMKTKQFIKGRGPKKSGNINRGSGILQRRVHELTSKVESTREKVRKGESIFNEVRKGDNIRKGRNGSNDGKIDRRSYDLRTPKLKTIQPKRYQGVEYIFYSPRNMPNPKKPSVIFISKKVFLSLQQDQLKSRGFAPNLHLVKIINELGLTINGLVFETTRQFGDYIEKAKAENDGESPINNATMKGYSANEVEVTVEGQSRGILEVQKVTDDPLFKSFGFSAPILNKSEFVKEREHRFVYIIIITDDDPTEERAA